MVYEVNIMDLLIYSLFSPRVGAINILHIFTSADCGLINTVLQATRSTVGNVKTVRVSVYRVGLSLLPLCRSTYKITEKPAREKEKMWRQSTYGKLNMYTSTGERGVILRIGLNQPKSYSWHSYSKSSQSKVSHSSNHSHLREKRSPSHR